jgi:hypothetical protein
MVPIRVFSAIVALVDLIALVVLFGLKKKRPKCVLVFIYSLFFTCLFGSHMIEVQGKEGLGEYFYYSFIGKFVCIVFLILAGISLLRIDQADEIPKKRLFFAAISINLLFCLFYLGNI